MEVVSPMKKALVVLALPLALALTIPVVNAGRMANPDGDLPPFDARELAPSRDISALAGLERDGGYRSLVVGAAVPGAKAAQCQVRLLDANARLLEIAELRIDSGSNGQVDFADRIGPRVAAGAQVSCDQPFYSYAAAAGTKDPKLTWGEGFGPNAPCGFTVDSFEVSEDVFVAGKEGQIHAATKGKEKGVVCINVPRDLNLDKMIVEWDVTPGPWFGKNPSGNHNMLFLHRGRFRSNTVANVNAFGPGKSFVKSAQNVDLPPKFSTNQKMGFLLDQARTFHYRYTYDAGSKTVTTEMFVSGVLLKTSQMGASAQNRVLKVKATGLSPKGALFAEFGHHAGQHPPEVPGVGWRFANLRVEMRTKN
jgi:hypothetical protein